MPQGHVSSGEKIVFLGGQCDSGKCSLLLAGAVERTNVRWTCWSTWLMSLLSVSDFDIQDVFPGIQKKSTQGSLGKDLQEWNVSEVGGGHGPSSGSPWSCESHTWVRCMEQ